MSGNRITSDVGPYGIVPSWLVLADISDRALRLFAYLAWRADRDSKDSYPRRRTIAKELHTSVKSIDRAMHELVTLGVVTIEERWDGDVQLSNLYRVHHASHVTPPGDTGDARPLPTDDAPPGDTGDAHRGEPDSEKNQTQKNQNTSDSADVRAVFDAWVEAAGRTNRTRLDDKRRRLIKRALKDYELDEVLDAVRGWRNSPHHRGESNGTIYNDLGLLLRDAEHIERFRDLERAGPPRRGPRQERNIDRDRSAPTGRVDSL